MGLLRPLGLLLLVLWPQIYADEGILHAVDENNDVSKDYCITYNLNWTTMPLTYKNATSYKLENRSSVDLCIKTDILTTGVKDKAVVVIIGKCTILDKAKIAQENGAKMLLVTNKDRLPRMAENKSGYDNLTIPIAFVSYEDIMGMSQVFRSSINVTLYAPLSSLFDYSMLIIFLISVFTVALGGYWSGLSELEDLRPSSGFSEIQTQKQKDDNVTLTPLTVVLFFVVCCAMLLLLYYFYEWLVYVIIAVFCLASAMSLFNCLSALIYNIPYGRCRISCFSKSAEVRLLILGAFCVAVSVTWAVFRNEDRWIWILQDILGIAFCLNFIKTLKMPNFKACVILLGLLLVYDVFFVFITPFFTKNGESIMVEVAAGPSGNTEKLPVVIRVPRMEFSANKLCGGSTSILGFGDIIVPGLLVAYCRRFDVRTTSSSVYSISCTIAYAVGMVITFVVLIVMKRGQPALLYLVPCTLITSSAIALIRKEMKKFWNGGGYEIMEHVDNAVSEENATCGDQESQ